MLDAAERSQLETLFYSGRFTELEDRARLLLTQHSGSGFIWNVLGLSLQMQGKDGVAALQKATELLPDDADIHCKLGNALSDQGRLNEAEASYRRALEIKPDYAEIHNNLSITLKELGRLDEAEASYRRALEIKPDYAEAHSNLGITLKGLGQLDEAIASYRRVLEIKPDFAEVHSNLASALLELGRLGEAEASYRRVLELKPDFAEALCDLGNVLWQLNRLDEAEASYRRALEIKPDLAEAHCNLGNTLWQLNRPDEAEASYRRALKIKPELAIACCNMGGLLKSQGRLDEALACFQQYESLKPGNCEMQHQIASLMGINTDRAPIQYIENLFDTYAYKFDSHLQQRLKYEIPKKIVVLITQHATLPGEKWNVLDLGCGTGLVGSAIAPFARQLTGVDLSTKMLHMARARNLYQRLEHQDLLVMMQHEKASSYDVIIAADVFIYLGKLDGIFSEIKRLLCPGGIAAFSIEAMETSSVGEANQGVQPEYRLELSGRYSHTPDFVTRLAIADGFQVEKVVSAQIRTENGKPVNGYMVLLRS